MSRNLNDDEMVYVTVPLDKDTAARLVLFAEDVGVEKAIAAAELLRDLLDDDVIYNVQVADRTSLN